MIMRNDSNTDSNGQNTETMHEKQKEGKQKYWRSNLSGYIQFDLELSNELSIFL